MFWNMIKMDCKRCFQPKKVVLIIGTIVALMFLTIIEELKISIQNADVVDILHFLDQIMGLDEFKIIMALALGALYTGSVCSDDNHHYLRLLLARVKVGTYIKSRFIVNVVAIISISVVSLFLFALLLSPYLPLWNTNNISSIYDYVKVLEVSPILYVVMLGVQWGMINAACSSIAFVFSAYQPNRFVTLGLVGTMYFFGLSYTPNGTIFNLRRISSMDKMLALHDFPLWVHYTWGILYPTIVIVICAYLFYRRMEWRKRNGYI